MCIIMSRHKDKLIDKIGTIYIVFILAVPSLAYIFLFKAIGFRIGLPTTFDMEHATKVMYILHKIGMFFRGNNCDPVQPVPGQ